MNKVLSLRLDTKEDWLNYLAAAHPISIDLGLERIKIVAARLDVLNFDCPVITVAGTNGKGSCVALTQAILAAAGYRVGTYTSPHLLDYNERIQIAGKPISNSELCEAFNCIASACAEVSLTYFEFGTLAALLLFKQAQLDAIILEVGLGGRLDAVNCVDADISVISMVDLDHMEWLGDTRELIAKEKAGIMRPNKPCVFGDFSLPVSIYEHATLENVFLYRQGQQFDYKKQLYSWSWQSQQQSLTDLPLPKIDLQNAATVLQIIELLSNQFSIGLEAIKEGLKQVFIPGRFQLIEQGDLQFILDVAHNPAGARCLAKRLAQEPCAGKTYAVVGMLVDKDISNTLAPLAAKIDQFYLAGLEVSRGATAEQLKQHLIALNAKASARVFSSPGIAVQEVCKAARKGDRVLVFGSFYTVSLVFAALDSAAKNSVIE